MTLCGPIRQNLLRFSTIAFLTAYTFSQAHPAPPKYDPATETTFKAVVGQLKFVPPTGGKPVAYLEMKSSEESKSGPDPVQVFLCPKSFLDDMGVTFKADDAIQVTGSKVKQDGADLILAREVVKGEDTLILRFKDGKPAW